jgi:hypothetical protein
MVYLDLTGYTKSISDNYETNHNWYTWDHIADAMWG